MSIINTLKERDKDNEIIISEKVYQPIEGSGTLENEMVEY